MTPELLSLFSGRLLLTVNDTRRSRKAPDKSTPDVSGTHLSSLISSVVADWAVSFSQEWAGRPFLWGEHNGGNMTILEPMQSLSSSSSASAEQIVLIVDDDFADFLGIKVAGGFEGDVEVLIQQRRRA